MTTDRDPKAEALDQWVAEYRRRRAPGVPLTDAELAEIPLSWDESQVREVLATALRAAREAERRDERAWLIEDVTTPTTHYWSANGWTIDPNIACRFLRQQDAEAVLAYVRRRLCVYRAAEHLWPAARPAAPPEEPKGGFDVERMLAYAKGYKDGQQASRPDDAAVERVVDPGHVYALRRLDGVGTERLTFVKREGPRYPGNVGSHPGTTMQEVLRALIDRAEYVNRQIPNAETDAAIGLLKTAILLFESRAAREHGLVLRQDSLASLVEAPVCDHCLHIECPIAALTERAG